MKVCYVAGPYRADTIHETVQNIRAAEAIGIELWKLGMAAIVPHLNTALFDGVCSDDTWLAGDLEILSRCDLLVLVPGWRFSSGSVAEYERALELGLKAYQWRADIRALELV